MPTGSSWRRSTIFRPAIRRAPHAPGSKPSHIPSSPTVTHARRQWNQVRAAWSARRRPCARPPAGATRRALMPGSGSLPGAAGKPSSGNSSSATGARRCTHRRRAARQSISPPPPPPWGGARSERGGVRSGDEVVRRRCRQRALLEEIAARAGGLGLVLDRVCKRGFHHRVRGVGPLDRSPWVTARTASRKSGIGAGQAGKNVVKSVGWCSLPRAGCPRSRESGNAGTTAVPTSTLCAIRFRE